MRLQLFLFRNDNKFMTANRHERVMLHQMLSIGSWLKVQKPLNCVLASF